MSATMNRMCGSIHQPIRALGNRVPMMSARATGASSSRVWAYATLYRHHNRRQYSDDHGTATDKGNRLWIAGGTLASASALFALYSYYHQNKQVTSLSAKEIEKPAIDGVKRFTLEQVRGHNSKENGIWVTFHDKVYDISSFVEKHPGGDKILMAAGGALEPFWALYAIHNTKEVTAMLEEYRIGQLAEGELHKQAKNTGDTNDPFANEPARHPALRPNSEKPFNAEPPVELLVDNYITPNSLFFVRNHLPVPSVDIKDYRLEVTGKGVTKPISLTFDDLRAKFPKHTVTATIQCAGNRRQELNQVKSVKGLNWGSAAISTAEWSGARLKDVLEWAEIDPAEVRHIQFEGLDKDAGNQPYGASIPVEKALSPEGDVLLAYEMNGEEIGKDHGYPVRLVAPGTVGARNVKWLTRVIPSKEESHSHWQRRDYKGFSPATDWTNVDWESVPSIQDLPVQSSICQPRPGEVLEQGEPTTVRGYAWSGGGRGVVRVDVSADGGHTWHVAKLRGGDQPYRQAWAWVLWEAEVPLQGEVGGEVEICCKAVDSAYNVQPESAAPIWNMRGVLCNNWHKVKVTLDNSD